MHILLSLLSQLGYDQAEQELFLLCFQYNDMSIASLARLTNKARSTIHGIISRLIASSMVIEYTHAQTTLYKSINLDQLQDRLSDETFKFQQLSNNIRDHYDELNALRFQKYNDPLITYYTAQELDGKMYDRILQSQHVRSMRDMDRGKEIFHKTDAEIIALPRISPGLTQRILNDSPLTRHYISIHQSDKYQLKLFPIGQGAHTDLMIMDGQVFHGSSHHKLQGVQIQDETFYDMMCMMFDNYRAGLPFPNLSA